MTIARAQMNRQLYQTGGNTLPIYPRIKAIETSLGGAEERIGDPALGQSSNSPLSNVYNNETFGTGIGSIFGNTGSQQPNPIQPGGAVDPIGFNPPQQPIQPSPSVMPLPSPNNPSNLIGKDNPFFNSEEFNKVRSYSGPANHAVYNSPYFGSVGSGTTGSMMDKAYEDYMTRIGTPIAPRGLTGFIGQPVSSNFGTGTGGLIGSIFGNTGSQQPMRQFSYGGRAGYQEGGRSGYQEGGIGMMQDQGMYNPLEENYYSGMPMGMAGGGIANLVPREKYGLGSSLKKFVRNIIPNEISAIAVKAAPFVAPFNPLLAAGMAGIGSFDQTGKIGSSLKSAALTYGGGQLGRYVGGAGFQTGFNPFDAASLGSSASSFIGVPYSSPIGTTTGLQLGQYELFGAAPKTPPGIDSLDQVGVNVRGSGGFGGDLKTIFSLDSNVGLETRAKAAMNLTGDAIKAMYTVPDGKGGTTLDKKAVISTLVAIPSYLDAKKKADQIGLSPNEFNEQVYNEQKSMYQTAYQSRLPMESFGIRKTAAVGGMMDDGSGILSIKLTPAQGMAMGGEIPVRKNQGGVSELDLRAKGGYIPVGIKEKADDVPAMLSKNEFVFTADAVRGAGNGSINKGAQKMYKLMKSLEKKVKKTKVA